MENIYVLTDGVKYKNFQRSQKINFVFKIFFFFNLSDNIKNQFVNN